MHRDDYVTRYASNDSNSVRGGCRSDSYLTNDGTALQIKDRSTNALLRLVQQGLLYDIVYIDGQYRRLQCDAAIRVTEVSADFSPHASGAHDTLNVLSDALLGWTLLREGGVIVFDDYDWKDDKGTRAVKVALDHFMQGAEREIDYADLAREHTLILRKRRGVEWQ